jgi:hypothetical protein
MRPRFAVLLVLLGAGACAQPEPEPAPPTVVGDPLAVLRERERATRTLTATFRVTVEKPDGSSETSRGALVVARPDRLRLQIFSLGVLTVYDFTVAGDRFRVRLPLEGVDRRGRFADVGPADRRLLRFDLRPLFLGGELGGARVEEQGGRVVLSTAERRVEIGKADARVLEEIVFARGEGAAGRLEARYDDYRAVRGVELPHRIVVEYPRERVRLTIEVSSYTRDEPADDALFRF